MRHNILSFFCGITTVTVIIGAPVVIFNSLQLGCEDVYYSELRAERICLDSLNSTND